MLSMKNVGRSWIFALTGAAMTGAVGAETFESNSISFRDITGSIEIKTTTGEEIDISISQGSKFSQVALTEKDGVVYVTGEKWREDEGVDCCDRKIRRDFNPRQGRTVTTGEPVDEGLFADYPTITVSMPFKGDVEFIDARMKLQMERLDGRLALDACYVYGQTSDVDEAVIGIIDGS